jgi:hypothetical protein
MSILGGFPAAGQSEVTFSEIDAREHQILTASSASVSSAIDW